jgi:hypothetical protein
MIYDFVDVCDIGQLLLSVCVVDKTSMLNLIVLKSSDQYTSW